MKTIPLTQGQFAIVDDEDYEELSHHRWHAHWNPCTGSFYAARRITLSYRRSTIIRMHRQILGLQYRDKLQADHRNHNTLDNRRENLRTATSSENQCNSRRRRDNTSGFKGVSWNKDKQKWEAYVGASGKQQRLGYFSTAELAYTARVDAAKCLQKEFTCP